MKVIDIPTITEKVRQKCLQMVIMEMASITLRAVVKLTVL